MIYEKVNRLGVIFIDKKIYTFHILSVTDGIANLAIYSIEGLESGHQVPVNLELNKEVTHNDHRYELIKKEIV